MGAFNSCTRVKKEEEIRILDYSHFQLNDVPNEVFLFERTLDELQLDSNRIKDLPRPLFHCHGLKILRLSDNEITSLPPAIASLSNLLVLDVSKNGILDIPDNIKECKLLQSVNASVNPLGKLPEGFTQLLSLQELYLNDTLLEYLPANFGRLYKLTILELRENSLNSLPKSMSRLKSLERLDIGQNDFREFPEVVASFTSLAELWCDDNHIRSIPEFFSSLHNLTFIDLSRNDLETISPLIEQCQNLTDLYLSDNKLKEIPSAIGKLPCLQCLKLNENQLKSLPNSIGSLFNLQELDISKNHLEHLPSSLGLLRKLHTLLADFNSLFEIPPELGSCISMSVLSLRANQLTSLPAELGHLVKLSVLNLTDNALQYLPCSLSKLNSLQALWLSDNQTKPLMPVNSEFDDVTNQIVLSCLLLPQQPIKDTSDVCSETESFHLSVWEEELEARSQIKFDLKGHVAKPCRLNRAPTPYPKELKSLAKHTRNLALRQSQSLSSGKLPANSPLAEVPTGEGEGKMVDAEPQLVSVGTSEVLIKQAVVSKPQTSQLAYEAVRLMGRDQGEVLNQSQVEVRNRKAVNLPAAGKVHKGSVPHHARISPGGQFQMTHINDTSKTQTFPCRFPGQDVSQPPRPPPYNVASMYSKQASMFSSSPLPPKPPPKPKKPLCIEDVHESLIEERIYSNYKKGDLVATISEATQPTSGSEEEDEGYSQRSDLVKEASEDGHVSEHLFVEMKDYITGNMPTKVVSVVDIDVACQSGSKNQSEHATPLLGDRSDTDTRNTVLPDTENPGDAPQSNDKNNNPKQDVHEGVYFPLSEDMISTLKNLKPPSFNGPGTPPSNIPNSHFPGRGNNTGSHLSHFQTLPRIHGSSNSSKARDESNSSRFVGSDRANVTLDERDLGGSGRVQLDVQKRPASFAADPVRSKRFLPLVGQTNQVNSQSMQSVNLYSSRRSHRNHNSVSPDNLLVSQIRADTPLGSTLRQTNSLQRNIDRRVLPHTSPLGPREAGAHQSWNEKTALHMIRAKPHAGLPPNHKATGSDTNAQLFIRRASMGCERFDTNTPNPPPDFRNPNYLDTNFPSNFKLLSVVIEKNPGLGFSIAGGCGSPMNPAIPEDCSIYVTKIHPSGPASQLLVPGDQILEVDGVSVLNAPHQLCVEILKKSSIRVAMIIKRIL